MWQGKARLLLAGPWSVTVVEVVLALVVGWKGLMEVLVLLEWSGVRELYLAGF